MAGDFNSLPFKVRADAFDRLVPPGGFESGVVQLITQGAVPRTHPDHPHARRGVHSFGLIQSGLTFRSAYRSAVGQDPIFTTKTADFEGTVDYLFVSSVVEASGSLCSPAHWLCAQIAGCMSMPYSDADQAAQFDLIPNADWPSDHLALVSDLLVDGGWSTYAGATTHQAPGSSSRPCG